MYKGKILELIREKNSTNGNPRFTAVILDQNGNGVTMATTAPDSILAYGLSNYTGCWVQYRTETKRGRLTLVAVEPVEFDGYQNYINAEIDSVPDSPVYRIQISGCSTDGETGKTKYLNITRGQLELIRETLLNG